MGATLAVIREFKRMSVQNLAEQLPVVPEPTRAAISSYLSYQHRKVRNGVFVGQTSIQDVDAFAELNKLGKLYIFWMSLLWNERHYFLFLMIFIALSSDAGRCLDTPFQGGYRSDIFRADPFFAIFFSTPRLLAQTHLTRPVEIDDTYKLIYEGYSVTLMGQTDSDRVFHVRGVGISTNSTEEVGEIYLTAWKQHVQGFSPSAYLGDAAEAYANSARAVFPDLATRLMCYAHVYKVG